MVGETISHYRILAKLGGGGMGVVYRAIDTKLDRHVALKFLPPEMTRNDEARHRFVQEARAASALDHPNICTIYEIDSTDDGRMFIAMALYDGDTLKKKIADGALPVREALDIAIQIGQGLAEAHEEEIVHRDVKPANIMLTGRGLVKIVDFGVAKLLEQPGITRTGSTVGTLAYMSPEQVDADEADHRSDLWSLGVVLYEMFTGALPFDGQNHWAVINAIGTHEPNQPSALRDDVPPEVDALVLGLLAKQREARTPTAEAFLDEARACRAALEPSGGALTPAGVMQALRRPKVAVPAAVVILALVSATSWAWRSLTEVQWARAEALPEVERLVDEEGDFLGAFALAEEVEQIVPDDPLLQDLRAKVSAPVTIGTAPEGAEVYARPYGEDSPWRLLGTTPLEEVRYPQGVFEWRIEEEGYTPLQATAANPSDWFGNFVVANPDHTSRALTLLQAGEQPDEMVYVPSSYQAIPLNGFSPADRREIGPFLIDRYEVTNAEFKEFVDAGGYERRELWDGMEFVRDGEVLSWEEAMAAFVDETGRPGPATWELGDYPDGAAEHPVGGVSWYEAAAYAAFRERSLPTLYHWARAATSVEIQQVIAPRANFAGRGPVPVGSTGAIGAYGAYDMAGNVREWVWNLDGENRWSLGGAWSDRPYMGTFRHSLPPFDRSHLNGFRLVEYLEAGGPSEELAAPTEITRTDHRDFEPVDDAVYRSYASLFDYEPVPFEAEVEWRDDSNRNFVREKIVFPAGYGDERIPIYVMIPKVGEPPYKTAILFPGLFAFGNPGPADEHLLSFVGPEEFLWKSGIAVVWPVYYHSFERWDPRFGELSGPELRRAQVDRLARWREDLGRTVDYLETRDDLDTDDLIYMGFSYGASWGLPLVALEDRFRATVLVSGGFGGSATRPEIYSMNYLPRITIPTLMLNGRYDHIFPVETDQEPMFEYLGTPAEDKVYRVYDAGHWPLPRSEWVPETLDFLERYLGPID